MPVVQHSLDMPTPIKGPTRVPCCQCAFNSDVRKAGVYLPYMMASYLRNMLLTNQGMGCRQIIALRRPRF
jgi:hypothetical protein